MKQDAIDIFEAVTGMPISQVTNNVINGILFKEWERSGKKKTFIAYWLEKTGFTAQSPEFQDVMRFIMA